METRGIFSADDHVVEHPKLWTERLSKNRWGNRIPHVVHGDDGSDCWIIEGCSIPLLGSGSAAALMPDRAREPRTWDEVPPAAYNACERLRAMDADGVEASVLYPSVAGIAGETLAMIKDPELEIDCVRAYNDWLIEEWVQASPRFVPQCIVPLSSPSAVVLELRRAVAAGHRGVIFPPVTDQLGNLPHVNDSAWDALWFACEELEVPVCFHAGSLPLLELSPYHAYSAAIKTALHHIARPACSMGILANLLMSHILERHRSLTVVFAESSLGWLNFVIEAIEHNVRQFGAGQVRFEIPPRQLLKSQCRFVGWFDDQNLRSAIRCFGSDCVLWAWNFPIASCDWPNARQLNEQRFNKLDQADRRKVIWDNAASLYQR
jgi:predicted TIM-barrel fold metal-dependent hydrolase